jgi:hypothetical protein
MQVFFTYFLKIEMPVKRIILLLFYYYILIINLNNKQVAMNIRFKLKQKLFDVTMEIIK